MNDSIEELRKLNVREFYSPVSKFMHNTMMYVTRPLLKTAITPNQITITWILMQMAGSLLMIFGTYTFNVLGVVLFVSAALLDYVDGQIARIKKLSTYKGVFLEELGIYLGSPIFFICFSIGVARFSGDWRYFLLGIISALCILYSKLAVVHPQDYPPEFREKMVKLNQSLSTRSQKKIIYFFLLFRRSQPLNFLL
ncbi:MAG: CDP-alcohol phosphatidyltransferase family protein, partial [Nanoarchaeota archaeon]|nr:CDP-alcohol phosphatidyltransferase family protein [Nanoarchaeota archaeon]